MVAASGKLTAKTTLLLGHLAPAEMAISDVTLIELARLLKAGRITVNHDPGPWLGAFALRFVVLPVTARIAWTAASYDWHHRDPSDRHILATAHLHHLPLITCDSEITPFAPKVGVKVIW